MKSFWSQSSCGGLSRVVYSVSKSQTARLTKNGIKYRMLNVQDTRRDSRVVRGTSYDAF
jgi:hypothetical protein